MRDLYIVSLKSYIRVLILTSNEVRRSSYQIRDDLDIKLKIKK